MALFFGEGGGGEGGGEGEAFSMISFIFKALLKETGRVPGFILRHAGKINLASASFLTCVTHLPSSRRGTPVISHWSISLYVLWVTLG